MNVFDLLNIPPKDFKVHFAVFNGIDDPLDLYFKGEFKEWQETQNNRNFQRKNILGLIRYQRNDLWLFSGVYEVINVSPLPNGQFKYVSKLADYGQELIGRLILQYKITSRAMYRNAETISELLQLYEIKPTPLSFSDFTSYKDVLLSRPQLEVMFQQEPPSWKAALSSVAGVYLQTDLSNGKHYVGSAYGLGGFWQRWRDYSNSYHGGNLGLKEIFKQNGGLAFHGFQYSILETVDIDTPKEEVIAIENRWKRQLQSIKFGYNEN
ncbi:MAG: GIY-YIG nuclease family protein [Lentisphaeraceae bacterium]|nr:GIY-YIG nuclease family protein [Lentisphaeraceae bacterium]